MRLDSLAFRLFATAALWTLLALPLAGFIIYSLYRNEVETSFDDRIKTLLLVVYTDSSEHATAEPGSPRDAGEPLFEIMHSGWYWQIKPTEGAEGRRTLVSKSLATETISSPYERKVPADSYGIHWATATGPNGVQLRIAEMIKALGDDEGGGLVVHRPGEEDDAFFQQTGKDIVAIRTARRRLLHGGNHEAVIDVDGVAHS